jgi:dipeptidyl aminopeptidase/acylaminoacyl peptidase
MNLGKNGWKALPLVAVAMGGLLWHAMACVESPMSFAPNGDLAFTTMEPYHTLDGNDPSVALRGTHQYQLRVLPAGADAPKVLEESRDWMITAPAFSPDGQRVAYLRILLLTAADWDELERLLKIVDQATSQPTYPPTDFRWPAVAETPQPLVLTAPASKTEDITLPSTEGSQDFYRLASLEPTIPAQLVQRSAKDGQVLSVSKIELPLAVEGGSDVKGMVNSLVLTYVLSRPQYSPDGRWIYLCPGNLGPGSVVYAVDLQTNVTRLVAAQVQVASLAPDGKTLAVALKDCLGFIRTDGSLATYVRWEKGASPAGLAWADNATLALLGSTKVDDKDVQTITYVKIDGTIARTLNLPTTKPSEDADMGQLAISPDGKHIVVTFDKATYFLDNSGTILGTWQDEKVSLAQPIFTPDGQQVAFKLMRMDEKGVATKAEAIVFTDPAGKELRRVSLLPPPPQATQPAEAAPTPVLQPAPPTETGAVTVQPLVPPSPTTEVQPAPAASAPVTPPPPRVELTEPNEPTSMPVLPPEKQKDIEELRPEMP